MNMDVHLFSVRVCSQFFSIYPELLLGHMVILCKFLRTSLLFFIALCYFMFPPAVHKDSSFSTFLPTLIFCLFDNSHPNESEVLLHGFDLHFPNNQWCWVSFHVLFVHLYLFLEKWLFRLFAILKLGCFLCCWVSGLILITSFSLVCLPFSICWLKSPSPLTFYCLFIVLPAVPHHFLYPILILSLSPWYL